MEFSEFCDMNFFISVHGSVILRHQLTEVPPQMKLCNGDNLRSCWQQTA